VFTARYALSPYIKQIRFVFKGLNDGQQYFHISVHRRDNAPVESPPDGRNVNGTALNRHIMVLEKQENSGNIMRNRSVLVETNFP
jgi:hypothetical protein